MTNGNFFNFYNTTFVVAPGEVEREFLRWLEDEYLASARCSGAFASTQVCRLPEGMAGDEGDAVRYAVALTASEPDGALRWIETHAMALMNALQGCHGGKVLFFTTPMEIISEGWNLKR